MPIYNNLDLEQIIRHEKEQFVYTVVSRALQLPQYRDANPEFLCREIYSQIVDNNGVTYQMVVDSLHAIIR